MQRRSFVLSLLATLALPIGLARPRAVGAATPKMVTLPDHLQYQDLAVGHGAAPKKGDTVTVTYVGTLLDGTKFDASSDHGDGTFSFPIGQGQVIKGWDEGVLTMRPGGHRKLRVPPELGYGAAGAGGVIPPNATLIFDIKLLRIAH